MLCWLCLLVMFALYLKVWVSFPKHLSRRHDECSWIKGCYKSRSLGPEGVGNPLKAERSAFMGGRECHVTLKSILFESLSGADVPQRGCDCFLGILCSCVTVTGALGSVWGEPGHLWEQKGKNISVNKYMCPCTYIHVHTHIPKVKKLGLIVRKKSIKNQIHWSNCCSWLLCLRHFACLCFFWWVMCNCLYVFYLPVNATFM